MARIRLGAQEFQGRPMDDGEEGDERVLWPRVMALELASVTARVM